jgi:hypothetical protein
VEARTRWGLVAGAVAAALGVGLVGTGHPSLGGVTLLVGWAFLGFAIHRVGRRG